MQYMQVFILKVISIYLHKELIRKKLKKNYCALLEHSYLPTFQMCYCLLQSAEMGIKSPCACWYCRRYKQYRNAMLKY